MFISIHIFFNSCIPCRMQSISPSTNRFFTISIHALRVECNEFGSDVYALSDISIHALRVECNDGEPLPEMATVQFQFMHSEWSATSQKKQIAKSHPFQFMHSEWSATDYDVIGHDRNYDFNSCTPSGVQQQSIVFIFPFILYFVYVTFFYISYIIIFIKSFSLFVIIIGANLSGFLCILRIRPNFYLI